MMRPSPPLPSPNEQSRQPRVTQRLWDDEMYRAADVYEGQLGLRDEAYYDDDLPTQVMPSRSMRWADDPDMSTVRVARRSSPLVTRPLGARPGFPYSPFAQNSTGARQLLLTAAIALGILLVGVSAAFGSGLLTVPGSGDAAQTDTGPAPAATTAPTATLAPTATVTPLPAIAASFTSQDTTLLGSWQSQYGSQGYIVVGDTQQLPPGVQVTPANQQQLVWQSSTTDPRALQKATDPQDHIAACWYATNTFTVDVKVTDGQTYQLAMYFLDWDQQNRAEIVNVLDPATNAVLDTRSVTSFANGEYLVWNVRGHITLQITAAPSSVNAVVSGVFIAPMSAAGATPVASPAATATGTPVAGPGGTPTVVPTAIPTVVPAG